MMEDLVARFAVRVCGEAAHVELPRFSTTTLMEKASDRLVELGDAVKELGETQTLEQRVALTERVVRHAARLGYVLVLLVTEVEGCIPDRRRLT